MGHRLPGIFHYHLLLRCDLQFRYTGGERVVILHHSLSSLSLPDVGVSMHMQGGSAAVGMALAEPMGGGLFTTNVVFGLVVMLGAAAKVSKKFWWQASGHDVGAVLTAAVPCIPCRVGLYAMADNRQDHPHLVCA